MTATTPDGTHQDSSLVLAADGTQLKPPMLAATAGALSILDAIEEAAAAEVGALIPLWEEAHARGWKVDIHSGRRTWFIESPESTVGAGYEPPGEVCTGTVRAYDNSTGKTVTLTGVESNVEAVARVREFLGWPAEASA
jgi:hypothetical protein